VLEVHNGPHLIYGKVNLKSKEAQKKVNKLAKMKVMEIKRRKIMLITTERKGEGQQGISSFHGRKIDSNINTFHRHGNGLRVFIQNVRSLV
jgi:hypothetical protein